MNTLIDEQGGYTEFDAVVIEAERKRLQCDPKMGLALSGGGIRSASFSLGVLQALAKHNILKEVDYISTVSGGGYIGSALTWWRSKQLSKNLLDGTLTGTEAENFPFGAETLEEVSAEKRTSKSQFANLDFLRFHSSYLLPGDRLDLLSIVALMLRNILLSLIIHLSALSIVLSIFFLIPITIGAFENTKVREFFDLIIVDTFTDWLISVWNGLSVEEPISRIVFITSFHVAFYAGCLFFCFSSIYALGTRFFQQLQILAPKGKWGEFRYTLRIRSQKLFGLLLKFLSISLLLGMIPTLHALTNSRVLWSAILIFVSLVLMFTPFTSNVFNMQGRMDRVQRTLGAWLFLAMMLFISYVVVLESLKPLYQNVANWIQVSNFAFVFPNMEDFGRMVLFVTYSIMWLLFVIVFFFVGLYVNVNYLGIHRMYRDRLMELFLPSDGAVETQEWGASYDANKALIEDMCSNDAPRPYHLINANVVLVNSKKTKFRERGGASFILSPLYCGSEATGWRRSSEYMKKHDSGMTLATAMAISGAAANPYAGGGGSKWTRNRAISIVMSMLSLRLGYWAPNPILDEKGGKIPNYISPGITTVFLMRRLHEHNSILDLTDGGHFENLGLYELIRRELKTIIVCDASADPRGQYVSLATAIERARVDFRAIIEFPDQEFGLAKLKVEESDRENFDFATQGADWGFAIGRIAYKSGKIGKLIYIKPTLTKNLSPESISYAKRNPRFPHDTTADQFFDEQQFEIYRELGIVLGDMAVPHLRRGNWDGNRWNPATKAATEPEETAATDD